MVVTVKKKKKPENVRNRSDYSQKNALYLVAMTEDFLDIFEEKKIENLLTQKNI